MRTILGSLACLFLIVDADPPRDMRWARLCSPASRRTRSGDRPRPRSVRNALAEVEQSGAAIGVRLGRSSGSGDSTKISTPGRGSRGRFRRAVGDPEKIHPRGELTGSQITDLGHLYHAQAGR